MPASPYKPCCIVVMGKVWVPTLHRAEKAYKAYTANLAKVVRELKARWEKRKGKRLRYALNNARRRNARAKPKADDRRKRGPGKPPLAMKSRS